MSLAAFNIEKAKDADGRVIEPVLEFHAGAIRWAVQYIVLDGDFAELCTASHLKDFRCSITPRSAKAAALVAAVEDEYPYEAGDGAALGKLEYE